MLSRAEQPALLMACGAKQRYLRHPLRMSNRWTATAYPVHDLTPLRCCGLGLSITTFKALHQLSSLQVSHGHLGGAAVGVLDQYLGVAGKAELCSQPATRQSSSRAPVIWGLDRVTCGVLRRQVMRQSCALYLHSIGCNCQVLCDAPRIDSESVSATAKPLVQVAAIKPVEVTAIQPVQVTAIKPVQVELATKV